MHTNELDVELQSLFECIILTIFQGAKAALVFARALLGKCSGIDMLYGCLCENVESLRGKGLYSQLFLVCETFFSNLSWEQVFFKVGVSARPKFNRH
jgi:hypothetical protein